MTFECAGRTLGATLDVPKGEAAGRIGVLMVSGGTQTRVGSHRMFERLAHALAAAGYPCFRFDRRGVGDSEGPDPGFRDSAADLKDAAAAFRAQCDGVERVAGFGLCDGASALALFGGVCGLDALMLANPWLIETDEDAPAAPALRQHYRERLLSREGWRRLLTGRISYAKALRGLFRMAAPSEPSELAGKVASALAQGPSATLILARSDATGATAEALWNSRSFAPARARNPEPLFVPSDSHTFAKPGDGQALLAACLTALDRLDLPG